MGLSILVLLLISHYYATLPFWRRARRGLIPNVEDFAALSVVLYYDLGIALEVVGLPYPSQFFLPLLDASPRTLAIVVGILAAAPWLLRFGARLVQGPDGSEPVEPRTRISRKGLVPFYVVAAAVSVLLATTGFNRTFEHDFLWIARAEIGYAWGPLIVLFYVPLHLLAFYVRQQDSRRPYGLLVCLGLAAATVFATLGVGQRTSVLLPALVLVLFRFRITPARIAAVAGSLIVTASASLPLFRYTFSEERQSLGELLIHTLYSDVSHGQVLAKALETSETVGTSLLPYPMAGYWYAIWFFVPRSIAPFKLHSTSAYFTTIFVGGDPSTLNWGLAVGVIEELLLNVGILWTPLGLVVFGSLLGLLGRLSNRIGSLVVPSRLAGLWICGYHLPALLLLFATMSAACWVCHLLFSTDTATARQPRSRRKRRLTA